MPTYEFAERERPRHPLVAPKETTRDGDAVRDELACDDETEDGADSRGPCEREQAQEERDEAREPDAVHGGLRDRVDAVEVPRERQTAVTGKGEDLAGAGCGLQTLCQHVFAGSNTEVGIPYRHPSGIFKKMAVSETDLGGAIGVSALTA